MDNMVQGKQADVEATFTDLQKRFFGFLRKNVYEIIKKTMIARGKENVYIRIKADIPDANTVDLNFVQIPEEEGELLVAIIQALGDSGMGVTKAILN